MRSWCEYELEVQKVVESDGINTFKLFKLINIFFCEFERSSITRSIVVSCVNKNIELYTIGQLQFEVQNHS